MKKYRFRLFDKSANELFVDFDKCLWPFYAYEIVAPSLENKDLFSKLFIDLVQSENLAENHDQFTYNPKVEKKVKIFLKNEFPKIFSEDLIQLIIRNLKNNGIVGNNKIIEEAYNKQLLQTVNLSSDLKKIIILQDAITGVVVPHINIFNTFKEIQRSEVALSLTKSEQDSPSLLQIQNAYKFANLYASSQGKHKEVSPDENFDKDNFLFDEDELEEDFVTDFLQDEGIISDLKTNQKISKNSEIMYLNDSPIIVAFEFASHGNIATKEVMFSSPFDSTSDQWFTDIVNKSRNINKSVDRFLNGIEKKIDNKYTEYQNKNKELIAKELKKEENIKSITEDPLKPLIQLLNDKSLLNSYEEIQKLRLIKANAVHTEYGVFLEGLVSLISQNHHHNFDQIKEFLTQGKNRFYEKIKFLEFKNIIIPDTFTCTARYKQIQNIINDRSKNREYLLTRVVYLVLLESYQIITPLNKILEKDKGFLTKINELNILRNNSSHYNKHTYQNFNNSKQLFDNVVNELISSYLEEDLDGK